MHQDAITVAGDPMASEWSLDKILSATLTKTKNLLAFVGGSIAAPYW